MIDVEIREVGVKGAERSLRCCKPCDHDEASSSERGVKRSGKNGASILKCKCNDKHVS
jgi:hypothetical protein